MRFIRRFLLMNHQVWCNQIVNSSSKTAPGRFAACSSFPPPLFGQSRFCLYVRASTACRTQRTGNGDRSATSKQKPVDAMATGGNGRFAPMVIFQRTPHRQARAPRCPEPRPVRPPRSRAKPSAPPAWLRRFRRTTQQRRHVPVPHANGATGRAVGAVCDGQDDRIAGHIGKNARRRDNAQVERRRPSLSTPLHDYAPCCCLFAS